jgi:hypothetical protein
MEQKTKMMVPKYFKARTQKWLVEWFLSLQSHSLHSFFFAKLILYTQLKLLEGPVFKYLVYLETQDSSYLETPDYSCAG